MTGALAEDSSYTVKKGIGGADFHVQTYFFKEKPIYEMYVGCRPAGI